MIWFRAIGFLFLYILCFPSCIVQGTDASSKKITDWEAHLEHAKILSYLKRYDEALDELKGVLNEKPNMIEARAEIAKIYFYQKNYTEALDELNKIPENKMDMELRVLKGEIAMTQKDYSQAESIFRSILQTDPKNDFVRLKLAEILSWQKRYEESITFYRQILQNHPDDIQVRRRYAMVLMWMGKDAEAAEQLQETLK